MADVSRVRSVRKLDVSLEGVNAPVTFEQNGFRVTVEALKPELVPGVYDLMMGPAYEGPAYGPGEGGHEGGGEAGREGKPG